MSANREQASEAEEKEKEKEEQEEDGGGEGGCSRIGAPITTTRSLLRSYCTFMDRWIAEFIEIRLCVHDVHDIIDRNTTYLRF